MNGSSAFSLLTAHILKEASRRGPAYHTVLFAIVAHFLRLLFTQARIFIASPTLQLSATRYRMCKGTQRRAKRLAVFGVRTM